MNKDVIKSIDKDAELRFVDKVNARSLDGVRYIEGRSASVNSPTIIRDGLGTYEEVIRPGAFDKAVNDDIRIVKNHNENLLLGRSKNGVGTGRIFIDDEGGLSFSVPVRESRSHSVDTYDEIQSRDLDGCSFVFVTDDSGEKWTYPDEENQRSIPLREIFEFKRIYDVGPVTYPAYLDTSVVARSIPSRIDNKNEKEYLNDQYEFDQLLMNLGL